MPKTIPLLISIPHCSGQLPPSILASMLSASKYSTPAASTPDALLRHIFSEGDPFTDLLFELPSAKKIIRAPLSRFVVDLNRSRDESGENGVIKITDFQKSPLYPSFFELTPMEIENRLTQYYDPYHQEIEAALQTGQYKFFIDGHSMLANGPALGPDQNQNRPAICLGNFGDIQGKKIAEELSCSTDILIQFAEKLGEELSGLFQEIQQDKNYRESSLVNSTTSTIALNTPFDGGYILKKYSTIPFSIPGIMIEINRALYLDETTMTPIPNRINTLKTALNNTVQSILQKG